MSEKTGPARRSATNGARPRPGPVLAPQPAEVVRAVLSRNAGRRLGAAGLTRLDRWLNRGRDQYWEHLVTEELARSPDLVSVDIFDTILTRPLVGQDALFHLIGAKLIACGGWDGSPEDFVAGRRQAAQERPWASLIGMYEHPALAGRCDPLSARDLEAAVRPNCSARCPGPALRSN
jgi:hypothetical protein